MRLVFLTKLLLRFARMRIKVARKSLKTYLGDNYPVMRPNKVSFFA